MIFQVFDLSLCDCAELEFDLIVPVLMHSQLMTLTDVPELGMGAELSPHG